MPSAYGFELHSDFPLPRARRQEGSRGKIRIRRGPADLLEQHGEITALDIGEAQNGELITFAVARTGSRYLLACSVTGGFSLDPATLEVVAAPAGPADAWEHRLLAVAVPVMLAERGDLALHAAAIGLGDSAVLFCGPAGRGKSTLARAFAMAGYPVLSEDGVIASMSEGGWTLWPGSGGARIRVPWMTGPVTKEVVDLPGPEPEPLPPGGVVLLEPRGGDGRPRSLPRAQALVRLTSHMTHPGGEDSARGPFTRLAALLSDVPAYSLSLPDDLGRLPEAVEALAETLREPSPHS